MWGYAYELASLRELVRSGTYASAFSN
ncbi:hypothetical protein SAM23877_3188 [Streptomyces ambofaciens ATCC 23877]|uniref:Uncharacterized protein n=1 Tax=Streptomyces ambofaciens (strain ATCC 23877 / 3486 / DSM 40053 / JCM 4204 / NBRC 12836 / NRRL B-2516) TaxID=278992 RepID=A0A0K2ATT5_STRA7|nr:hypothetical protein SAM23877_3188 [Streptomyces ambofaciens ATCC 23877]